PPPQWLRRLRAQIGQLGASRPPAPAAHPCKHLVARSVLSPPLWARPTWSLSRLGRGSLTGEHDRVQLCRWFERACISRGLGDAGDGRTEPLGRRVCGRAKPAFTTAR